MDKFNCIDCKFPYYDLIGQHIVRCSLDPTLFGENLYCWNHNNEGQCKNFAPRQYLNRIIFKLFGKEIYIKCYPFLFRYHNWWYITFNNKLRWYIFNLFHKNIKEN